MFVIPTTEVRWFHQGDLLPSWLSWFERFPDPGHEEPVRIDKYLLINDSDGLGIKIRQGRLEIKQRLGSLGVVQISDHVEGLVEYWMKWSFEVAENEDYLSYLDLPGSNWTSVHKRRKLRRYQLRENGQVLPVSDTLIPPDSCEVELTEIWSQEQSWWSLAFEAAGEFQSSQDVLMTISRHLIEIEGAPKLTAKNSFGYPKWLVELNRYC
jgi:hypothetical protein